LRVRKYGPSQLGKNGHTFYVRKLSSAVYWQSVIRYELIVYSKCTVCRLCCKSATTVDFHRNAVTVPETSNWRECIVVRYSLIYCTYIPLTRLIAYTTACCYRTSRDTNCELTRVRQRFYGDLLAVSVAHNELTRQKEKTS